MGTVTTLRPKVPGRVKLQPGAGLGIVRALTAAAL